MLTTVERQTAGSGQRPLSSLYLTDKSRSQTSAAADEFLKELAAEAKPKPSKDLEDDPEPPRKYYEPHDIKIKLYLRECEKLRVIPVSAYIREPTRNLLKITHYNIGPDGARALAAALLLDTTISYLDIEGNSIGPTGLASIQLSLVDNLFITHLNIADNKLGSQGAQLVGKLMLANHCIEILNVSRNGFLDTDCEVFAHILRENRVLKELVLAGNEFGDTSGTVLGAALAVNENLERLDISWNHVRKQGAADFAQGVKENISLKKLNVSFNGFGSEGAASMSLALATNRTLLELDMSKNRLVDVDMRAFSKHLPQNEALQVLKIGDNPMTPMGAICVLQAVLMSENSTLQHVDFGNTSIDKGFLSIMKKLQEVRDIQVTYGRVQNLYADKEMEPKVELTIPPASELSEAVEGDVKDDSENMEKGKTYVVDKKKGDQTERERTTQDVDGERSEYGGVDFNEQELDKEVAAVTGKPDEKVSSDDKVASQEPVYTERASVGTLTPDI